MFCGKCGTPVDEQTGMCPNCDMPQPTPEQPKKPKDKKNGKIIAVIVISVILSITIIFTALFGWKLFIKEEPATVNTEEQNEKEQGKVPPIYGKVSEQYAKAILQRGSNASKGEYVNGNLFSKFNNNENYKVFFSLIDINKDGTSELIIGGGEDKKNTKIYDIFTNDGKNPVALFPVGSIGDEKTLDVYDNGNIKVSNEQSSSFKQYDYFTLPEKSTTVSHQMGLTDDDGKYYKHDENGNYISSITQQEYNEIVGSFESAKINPEWTEFVPEDYVSENDATETKVITFEEARNIAKTYWNYKESEDGYCYQDGLKLAIFGDESEAVESGGIKYYYFRLRALVDTYWTTYDMLYVNSETGECSTRLPDDSEEGGDLSKEQLESFDELINADFDIWGNKVEGSTINEYYINNYIYNGFYADEKSTMYNYYFPNQIQMGFSDPLNKFNDTYSQNGHCYIYDADKVLFILNDVFGLNVTTTEATDYYYFYNDKFYYCSNSSGAGNLYYTEREITANEKQSDDYYLITITQYSKDFDTNTIVETQEMEIVAKPSTHSQYGDYWAIKSMKIK